MTTENPDIPLDLAKKGIEIYEKGKLHLSKAEYQQAINCYLDAMRLTFDDVVIWSDIAECYMLMGDRENCISALRRSIELDPENVGAHHNLAMMLIDTDLEEAQSVAMKAIQLDGTISTSWLQLGKILYLTNRLDLAKTVLQAAINFEEDNAEAYHYLGKVFEALEDYDYAEFGFRKATKLDPDDAQYLKEYAGYLYRRSKFEKAISIFEKAHEEDPFDHEILTDLAGVIIAYLKETKKDDSDLAKVAMESLNKSLDLTRNYGKTWYHWGEMWMMFRDFEKGAEFFQVAIQMGFDIAESYMWLSGCLSQLGREEEATEMFEEYKKRLPKDGESPYM